MTVPSVSALSTFDWIRQPDSHLKEKGADPAHRIHYTGHTYHVQSAWVPSIGCWGLLSARQFANDKDKRDVVLRRVKENAFRQFRYRYRLKTKDEFVAAWGNGREKLPPWFMAQFSWLQHKRQQQLMRQVNGDIACSIGVACEAIYTKARDEFTPIGILPIELVIWTRIFDKFLGTIHSFNEWRAIDAADRHEIWNAGPHGSPWDQTFNAELTAPAIFRIADRTPIDTAEQPVVQ